MQNETQMGSIWESSGGPCSAVNLVSRQVLDNKGVQLFGGFLLLPSRQADMVCYNSKAGEVFFVFFPPASVWLRRDMIDDDKNRNIAVAMLPPLFLQVLRSRLYLCWKVLHADDSEADRHMRELQRGFSVVVETWDIIQRDWDGLSRISEFDVIGSHLPRAP